MSVLGYWYPNKDLFPAFLILILRQFRHVFFSQIAMSDDSFTGINEGRRPIQSGSSIVGQIRPKGRISCHRWWARASKGQGCGGTFYMGSRGKSRHLDASVEGRTQDFMSRNSLGSPTFMFYPVIMMSTYTPDKTKHYPSSFSPSLFLSDLLSSSPTSLS